LVVVTAVGMATASTPVPSSEPWLRQMDRNPLRRKALVMGAATGNVSDRNSANTWFMVAGASVSADEQGCATFVARVFGQNVSIGYLGTLLLKVFR
jgi:hypothetical protein